MRQGDLNRAVARATGESVRLIDTLGFGLVPAPRPRAHRRRRRRLRHSGQLVVSGRT